MAESNITNMTGVINGTVAAAHPTASACAVRVLRESSYIVASWIRANRFFIQLPIATIGLIMVFIVYGRKMTKSSLYLFICVLALADLSFIVMDTIFHTAIQGYDWGDVGCGVIEYFYHVSQMFAVGVLVFLMFHVMLVTVLPARLHFFTTTRTAIALVLLFISVCAINAPYTYSKQSVEYMSTLRKGTHFRCLFKPDITSHIAPIIYIKMYVFYFIAMGFLLFCSLATSIMICLMRKARDVDSKKLNVDNQMPNGDIASDVENNKGGVENGFVARMKHKDDDVLRDLTIMVLTVSICFIVLALPYGIYFVPYSPISGLGTVRFPTCDESLFLFVFSEICKLLYDMQHCLNAYLYCLSSSVFRRKLVVKLRCKTQATDRYVMSETTMTTMAVT